MPGKIFLPVIAGPTASGKTSCTVELCKIRDGEVVSADSMQVFRGMELLSAAPTVSEMQGIPHHMIGIASPSEPFSAATYRDKAAQCIAAIDARGKTPILCGGTGLYIDAVTRPMRFSEHGDEKLRAELHAVADSPGGREKLHAMLAEVDPESARRLHYNDVRRVVRALEVFRLTGVTLTEQNLRDSQKKGEYDEMIFAIDRPRDELYARIDARVGQMLESGLLDEVRRLMELSENHPTAIQAIGYKEIASALHGDIPVSYAIEKVKQASRNYAKRQITWLKRDGRTIWINASGRSAADVAAEISEKIDKRCTNE
jgi:tRNA dimethylallyltransferase